jgi:hypothetical protein
MGTDRYSTSSPDVVDYNLHLQFPTVNLVTRQGDASAWIPPASWHYIESDD